MKKLTLILLCMCILPTACWAEAVTITMQLDKTNYALGENIIVSIPDYKDPKLISALIGVFESGASHDQRREYEYLSNGEGEYTFKAPEYNGDFEIRLFLDSDTTEESFVTSVQFVSGEGNVPIVMQLNKTEYALGESITVSVPDYKNPRLASALIGVYESGAPHDQRREYEYLSNGEGEYTFKAPEYNGDFEIRLFLNSDATEESFVTSVQFISGEGNVPIVMLLNKADYALGESIIVSVPDYKNPKLTSAWLGIYESDAPNDKYGEYEYLSNGEGEYKFKAPEYNGNFEIRLFSNSEATEGNFVTSVQFVLGEGNVPIAMQLNKADYVLGESITISVQDYKNPKLTSAWLGIYESDAPNDKYIEYEYLSNGEGEYKFKAPEYNGNFEIRLFSNSEATEGNFITSTLFTVGSETTTLPVPEPQEQPKSTTQTSGGLDEIRVPASASASFVSSDDNKESTASEKEQISVP